ncbi:MAG: hypothetical protein EBR82_71375 [Caulobacteraceae bacterium]|nr:hypothetical protein [Caulobacteraceae bacterium]
MDTTPQSHEPDSPQAELATSACLYQALAKEESTRFYLSQHLANHALKSSKCLMFKGALLGACIGGILLGFFWGCGLGRFLQSSMAYLQKHGL